MRKVLVGLFILATLGILFAGEVRLSLAGSQVSWSQTLTFTVKQWIKVTWDYDPAAAVAVDDSTYEANVGNLTFQSNKAFKVYYTSSILGGLTSFSVTGVKVGAVTLSSDQNSPTQVPSKLLSGAFVVQFDSGVAAISDDFSVKFDFTFLPF